MSGESSRAIDQAPDAPPARLTVGVHDGQVFLSLRSPGGETELAVRLKPEDADALSADLRRYSLEVRNGGRLT